MEHVDLQVLPLQRATELSGLTVTTLTVTSATKQHNMYFGDSVGPHTTASTRKTTYPSNTMLHNVSKYLRLHQMSLAAARGSIDRRPGASPMHDPCSSVSSSALSGVPSLLHTTCTPNTASSYVVLICGLHRAFKYVMTYNVTSHVCPWYVTQIPVPHRCLLTQQHSSSSRVEQSSATYQSYT